MSLEITQAINAWALAVSHRDSAEVIALYDPDDGVLLGTFAPQLLRGREAIKTYFDSFLDKEHIAVNFDSREDRELGSDAAVTSGIYTFSWQAAPDTPLQSVTARFSFVLRRGENNQWLIVDHHSSVLPKTST